MSQDITFVPVKKIKAAKTAKKGLAPANLDQLYDSISKEGLLHPIILRPDPESPGFYKIVAGEHRFYVVAKMCKDEVIAARIFADMSEEEAELAALSENVCRTNAKPADRLLSIRKWQEMYRKHFPHLEGKKSSGASRWANSTKAEAKQKAIDEEKAQEEAEISEESRDSNRHCGGYSTDEVSVEAEVASETAAEPVAKPVDQQTFRERVQSVTGVSERTLDRELRIIRGLSEEQCYVLEAVQCPKMGMLKIIDATDDKGKRGEIVSLVASGMEVEQAIKEVVGVTATKDAAGRVKEVGEPKKTEELKLTDEEWFERECNIIAPGIANPDQYKSDSILWRQIADARTEFRKKIKKILAAYREERRGKRVGWFFLQLNRVISVSHPKDWNLCERCGGSGAGKEEGQACEKCHGAGYDVRTERY